MPPVKNPCVMTYYGGIIRIRLKGRRSYLPLSLSYKLPCFYFDTRIIHDI